MLTDNNQIFRNCFIIYFRLTKVSSQINKCIIFEPNELSVTLFTLYIYGSPSKGDFWILILSCNFLNKSFKYLQKKLSYQSLSSN